MAAAIVYPNGVEVTGTGSGRCDACINMADHERADCRMNLFVVLLDGYFEIEVTSNQLTRIKDLSREKVIQLRDRLK